jgi:hypothetical protein
MAHFHIADGNDGILVWRLPAKLLNMQSWIDKVVLEDWIGAEHQESRASS